MPPDHKLSKRARTSSYKDDDNESSEKGTGPSRKVDIETKRTRGEASCAECRRLRIRCDKEVPCTSCIRRGCASICPNGSLATGQGTRFVLAATEHLQQRLTAAATRVRQLENAIAALHARHSKGIHPLLAKKTPARPSSPTGSVDTLVSPQDSKEAVALEMQDAHGTLSIGKDGHSERFLGPTGGTELLLATSAEALELDDEITPNSATFDTQTRGPRFFSAAFPFSPIGNHTDIRRIIESHLPEVSRAQYLGWCYGHNMHWIFPGVSRFRVEEVLFVFYSGRDPSETNHYSGPHKIALLFLICAIGALVDLSQPPLNEEAEHYFQIARVAISQQSILEQVSLITVEMLALMSMYYAMTGGDPRRRETSWSLVKLAARCSIKIGLQRDCGTWGLPDDMVERRRRLFYSVFAMDTWQSLSTGRPPAFPLFLVDCKYPEDTRDDGLETAAADAAANWSYRFAKEIVIEVVFKTLVVAVPNYDSVMQLDNKIRKFSYPVLEQSAGEDGIVMSFMTSDIIYHREVILLYMHRSFFAEALMRYPEGPMASPFSASYLASYRASKTISRTTRELFAKYPAMTGRFWQIWTFTFSCAIIFGSIVTHSPRSALAANALVELEQMRKLFTDASAYSRRASKGLPIILRLHEKAIITLRTTETVHGPLFAAGLDNTDDELLILAGKTKLLKAQAAPDHQTMTSERHTESHSTDLSHERLEADTNQGSFSAVVPTMMPMSPIGSLDHRWSNFVQDTDILRNGD